MPRTRTQEYPPPAGATPWGVPLSDPSLAHEIVPPGAGEHADDLAHRDRPPVRDRDARVRAAIAADPAELEYWEWPKGAGFGYDHDRQFHDVPFETLRPHFTTDEVTRMLWGHAVMSRVGERYERDPLYTPLAKTQNSMWQWRAAGHDSGYGHFARLYAGLKRFDFGLPGFAAYLDHTDYLCGTEGPARYARDPEVTCKDGSKYTPKQWLDGHFAFQVVRDAAVGGGHVLTVGFALSGNGVLVSQIQVRGSNRGNRWLYKLPKPLREYALDRVRAAWPGETVALMDGDSHRRYGRYTHRSNPGDFPDAVADRVAGFYDAPLAGYGRAGKLRVSPGWGPYRQFDVLVPAAA